MLPLPNPKAPLLASRFASLPPVCAGGYPYDKNSLMMMAPAHLRPLSQGTQYFVAHGIGSVPDGGLYSLYFETRYGSGIPFCIPVRPPAVTISLRRIAAALYSGVAVRRTSRCRLEVDDPQG